MDSTVQTETCYQPWDRPRSVTPLSPSLPEPTPLPSLSAGLPFLPKPLHCVLIPGHTLRLTYHHSPLSHVPPPASPHSTQCIFLLKLHKIYSSCNYNVENENAEVQRGLWMPQPGFQASPPAPGQLLTVCGTANSLPTQAPPTFHPLMMGPDQDPACSLNTHSTPQAPPSLPGQRPHLSREDYFCPEGRASCLAPDLL